MKEKTKAEDYLKTSGSDDVIPRWPQENAR